MGGAILIFDRLMARIIFPSYTCMSRGGKITLFFDLKADRFTYYLAKNIVFSV